MQPARPGRDGARAMTPRPATDGRGAARLAILAAALLFSTGGAAIKAVRFSSWQVAGLRSGVAGLVLLMLVPAARRGLRLRVLPVAVAYAATLVLFALANKLTTAANSIFLQATAPLYILLLAPLVLRERAGRDALWQMAALLCGIALFFVGAEPARATAPDPLRGNLLAAASGVTWALTVMGLRWLGRGPARAGDQPGDQPGAPPGDSQPGALAAVVLGNLLAFLLCLPMAWPLPLSDARSWALVGYLGVFQVALAYIFMNAGLRHLVALEVSLLLLAEPALSPLWAWAVHGERPGALALAGGALIIAATTIKTWWDTRRARAA